MYKKARKFILKTLVKLFLMKNMRVVLLYSIMVLISSCDFAKGVKKDTQDQILSHKKFIKNISFIGLVSDLEYCNNCNFNKYQIIIDLKDVNVADVKLGDRSFPPYYTMTLQNKLSLSVDENLYEAVQKGFEIEKKSNSDDLLIKGKSYKILSQVQYEWIPK